MRAVLHPKLTAGRIRHGRLGSDDSYGHSGAFHVMGPNGVVLSIIASDPSNGDPDSHIAEGWEHVSVSLPKRCPNWPEMCFVKDLFWAPDECVVQFHPPESEYISNHTYCLHLWRDAANGHALPPSILVGMKHLGDLSDAPERARLAVRDLAS